ncbi:MAG: alpha/beta hydrolase [Bacillota bacterium]|nr:alpha/beta hydrolase [Bacillota bacterium]
MNGYEEKITSLSGHGGVNLYCKCWKAESVRGIVVIAHGLGEHCERYQPLIKTMQGQGLSFYAIDHRGHGRSGGPKGHINHFSEYVVDLKRLFDFVRQEEGPALPICLLGHSMGGVIAFQYALSYPGGFDTLILSSAGIIPAVPISAFKKKMASVLSVLLPKMGMVTGLEASLLSHDKDVVQAYIDDPLVHDRVSSRWYMEFTRAGEECLARASELTMPLLIIHGKEDGIVDYHGSEEVMEKAASQDKQIFVFEGLYHETMNELAPENSKVLQTISTFILNHMN